MTKIIIGLVIGNLHESFRDKWVARWYKQACRIGSEIIVIDNSTDGSGTYFHNKPKVVFYLKQSYNERHMNRDYQRILDFARNLEADWILNLDIDEIFDERIDNKMLRHLAVGQGKPEYPQSYHFILFEMRNDEEHYIKLGQDGKKFCRPVSKFYKVMPHIEFRPYNKHGSSIPENILAGPIVDVKIKHLGHMTKEMREEKRNRYKMNTYLDNKELDAPWLQEDQPIFKFKDWEWDLSKEIEHGIQ